MESKKKLYLWGLGREVWAILIVGNILIEKITYLEFLILIKTESKLKKDDVILKGKIRSPSAASID